MRAEIQSWTPKPATVAVFGSAARGDRTAASDSDVLVVREESVEAEDPQWAGEPCIVRGSREPLVGELVSWRSSPQTGSGCSASCGATRFFLHADHKILPPRTGTAAFSTRSVEGIPVLQGGENVKIRLPEDDLYDDEPW